MLDGVSLAVEVPLVGSAGNATGCAPVADRRPRHFGHLRVLALGHEVREVDVGCQHGIGVKLAAVHQLLEPDELLGIGYLVEALGVRSDEALVEEVAVGAEAVLEDMVVLYGARIGVGEGSALVDVAVAVQVSVHVDLLVRLLERGPFVLAEGLVPPDDGLVAVEQVAGFAAGELCLGDAGGARQVDLAVVVLAGTRGTAAEPAVVLHLGEVVCPETSDDGTAPLRRAFLLAVDERTDVQAALHIAARVVEVACHAACGTVHVVERDGAVVGAKGHAVAAQVGHDAGKVVGAACGHGHCAGEGAARDGVTAAGRAYDATHMVHSGHRHRDVQRRVYAGDGAGAGIAHDARAGSCRGGQCAVDAEVLDGGFLGVAEEAAAVHGTFRLEASDAVSLAVEDAGVVQSGESDGLFPGAVQLDVGRQKGVGACCAVACVHQVGECHEVGAAGNLVIGDAVHLGCREVLRPCLRSPHAQQGCDEEGICMFLHVCQF